MGLRAPSPAGGPLEVEPPEPEVAVAVGESLQFTCRLACEDGRAASVQWRGLDTSLGAVQSGAGSSVLSVLNASLSAAGPRVCVGSCGDVAFQHIVRLLVFGEPPPLPPSWHTWGPSQRPCFPAILVPPLPGRLPGLPSPPQLKAGLAGPPGSICSPLPPPRIPSPPIHPQTSCT